ncbi:N-carbamoyl-D-amino-acid hydrolase [Maritimibacter alkaliphilus]|uniref:N-carbamoyl-D-amino-acid hydrolase n=1 Tax=Maritimibacter alkaliphilus TaxID=404236 RepID=UPI001C955FCF|nr:N-carbamoyl-D-amino-acid hydrolase [Maritimibacter alkaliphilus]MBY6089677.1 N-carbamoyl-D-amino-acid hydrolase [Maritimibacter alkaliphilus]
MRNIRVAAAQLGPIQLEESRVRVIERMLDLVAQARAAGAGLIVFPELALTTFFPRWYREDVADFDRFYETQMPGPDTARLFTAAREAGMGLYLGYAELTPEGARYNSSVLVAPDGTVAGKYRKVHLPGHADYDETRDFQHLEKRYFTPGDLGFGVWQMLGGRLGMAICTDRRWPETYRVMGLKGVEMILMGYNTPSHNGLRPAEGPEKRQFHNRLSVQAGAYQNSTWVVAVAKAGREDGHHMIGGTLIVNPDGEIVAEARTEADELVVHDCDLDATAFGKQTMFDFARHRRIEHYGLIASQTGVEKPWGPASS